MFIVLYNLADYIRKMHHSIVLRSLEFTLNRVLMKVFRTTSMDVIAECRYWFGLLEMETLIAKRKQRFMAKYVQSDNVLCQLFAHVESV